MATGKSKDYQLLIRIAGAVDASLAKSLNVADGTIKGTIKNLDAEFTRLDKGYDKIIGMGKKAISTVTKLATAAAIPVGIASKQMIEAGASFEQQMSTVESISGATAAEMDKLSDKARYLGETTKYTATEVGQAMEYMGMAGWKSEQMLAGIEGVMNLAAASGEDLAMVSDMVTDNLTALGMTADESGRFVDVLAATATNANTNVALMKDTLKYAGPVAGALGYSIEDVAIALGIMANSGTKASIAGTALRNLFTNMANPTKSEAEAMEALGVSLADSNGKVYSFMDVMKQLRSAFGTAPEAAEQALTDLAGLTDEQIEEIESDLTEVERVQLSAQLAGKRGMSGLLAIVNATEKDFDKLTNAIYNSEGAAEKMAAIRLNNLTGDATIFKSALEGLYIATYEKVNPGLRKLVQYGTELIGKARKDLPDLVAGWVDNINEALPKLEKAFKKYALPVFDGIKGVFGYLVDNGDTVIGVIAGIGGALATYKIMSTAVHLAAALATLNPLSLAIMGVVAGAGLIVGHLAKVKVEEKELASINLASHFGDLTLSMEELEEVAETIVGKGDLQELRTVLDQYSQLDDIARKIDDAAESLDKLDWMVSLGVKLSDTENETYKRDIDAYITSVREYVIQAWNAGTSAVNAGFDNVFLSNVATGWINDYYSHQEKEFSRLGTELSNAMTEAFEDGFLDFDESKKIAEIRAKISRMQAELASSDLDKEIRFATEGGLGELTAESFSNLMDTIVEKETEIRRAASDVYVDAMSEATAGYKYEREQLQHVLEHSHDPEQLAKAADSLAKINQYYSELDGSAAAEELNKVGSAVEKTLTFGTGTLKEKYGSEITTAVADLVDSFDKDYTEGIAKSIANGENVRMSSFVTSITNTIKQTPLAEGAKEMVEKLSPTAEDAEALMQKYIDLGMMPPEGIIKGMEDYDLLKVLTGDEDAVYGQIIRYLSEEYPEYAEAMAKATETGGYIPENIADGMLENKDKIDESVKGLANQTEQSITDHFGRTFYAQVDLELQYEISEDLSTIAAAEEKIAQRSKSLSAAGKKTGEGAEKNALGDIITRPTLSWIGESGAEAIIPLNGSARARSLWEEAGSMLGTNSRFKDFSVGNNETMNVTYAPVINIAGDANKEEVRAALNEGYETFKRYSAQYARETARTAWARS